MTNQFVDNGQTIKLVSTSKLGWKVGAIASVPLSPNFNFMPQLNFLSKGAKFDIKANDVTSVKLTYLEIPLYITYSSNSSSGSFFGGVGPSFSYGVGGKATETSNGTSVISDVKFDGVANAQDNKYHLKAFEFGAAAILGYKLPSGLMFNLHYNLGLSNISPEVATTVKNSYFGFGLGYFLNSK
ncbi:MAG: hypothetical protein NVS1B13_07710 [Flavisolibacter sp.]